MIFHHTGRYAVGIRGPTTSNQKRIRARVEWKHVPALTTKNLKRVPSTYKVVFMGVILAALHLHVETVTATSYCSTWQKLRRLPRQKAQVASAWTRHPWLAMFALTRPDKQRNCSTCFVGNAWNIHLTALTSLPVLFISFIFTSVAAVSKMMEALHIRCHSLAAEVTYTRTYSVYRNASMPPTFEGL